MAQLLECDQCCALMTAERMRAHEQWHIEAERLLTAMTRSEARVRRPGTLLAEGAASDDLVDDL